MNSIEQINIQIHPRAFSSFGEDLVTNDIVAITELVKNAYDAYAFKTKIKFGDDNGERFISVKDGSRYNIECLGNYCNAI